MTIYNFLIIVIYFFDYELFVFVFFLVVIEDEQIVNTTLFVFRKLLRKENNCYTIDMFDEEDFSSSFNSIRWKNFTFSATIVKPFEF